ncbi:MAG: hypothetical protein JWM57_85 [Phycisphaerales bacterium]|nr:hypothetical protein [Phycisphaerales bacterium]
METAAFESDAMLKLLTEALRRGPGSPEWHSAVSSLRNLNSPDADEYRLLITARERIESGRAYREVRAGPAFTRELFGQLGAPPASGRRVTLGLVIRLLCLLTLVGAIGVVMMYVAQAGPHDAQQLSSRLFVTPVRSWTFDPIPSELHHVGPLPMETRNGGLRAGSREVSEPTGGLLYADEPLDLVRGTCVELRFDYRPGPTSVQLTLMSDAIVNGPLAAVSAELALICDNAGVHVSTPASATAPRALSAGAHLLRLKVADGDAVAELDGQVVWNGPPRLGPRGFVAIRMIRDGKANDVTVRSLRVLAP